MKITNHSNKINTRKKLETADAPESELEGIVCGRNAVIELLKSGADIEKIFLQSGKREGSITLIEALAPKERIPLINAERSKLDNMSKGVVHQGVVAVCSAAKYCSEDDILEIAAKKGEKPLIVIADGVCDPHNLGAIIRSCDGAGVHGVVIPKRRAVGLNYTVMKTSAGAANHVAVCKSSNLAATVDYFKKKGVWVVACEGGGTDYDTLDYDMPCAFIVGGEDSGVSRILKDKSDFVVNIPMLGKVNSLNVSCATAVILYNALISRKRKG